MEDQLLISILVLCASILIVLMLLGRWRKPKTKTTQNLPPGPWKLPIIGNIHQLVGHPPHRRLSDLAKIYGDIMHLKIGEVSHIIISSPKMAKEVMKTHDHILGQRPFLLAADIFLYNSSEIAFSPSGPHWRQLRKICAMELLSTKRVRSFRPVREAEVSNLISVISSSAGKPVNVSKLLAALTFGLVSKACFGKKCKDEEAIIKIVEEFVGDYLAGFNLSDVFPSIKFLDRITGLRSGLMRMRREADRILANIIDDHKAAEKETSKHGDEEDDTLLGVLLKLKDNANLELPLTIERVKAVMLDLFVGGGDTTSTTIIWALYEMLKNPRVMEKAQTEVREVFKDKKVVDETRIVELKYLKMAIQETMRVRPSSPLLLPRELHGESIEINGYTIPSKSKIFMNAIPIGRDPDYWTDPDTFFPERFEDNPVDFTTGVNFQMIPFGGGRRLCPGISFGTAIVELTLAKLLYHFDWKVPIEHQAETFDSTEIYGATVKKKYDMYLLPLPYTSSGH